MPAFQTISEVRNVFGWNAQAQRYTDLSTGKFVPQSAIRNAIGGSNGVIVNARIEIEQLAGQVATGEITIGEWQERMAGAVKNLDLATTASGKGGIAQLTQRDYGLAGQRLRDDYARLEKFARDIEFGRIKGQRISNRAKLYINRRVGSYENTRRDAAQEVFQEERRVLAGSVDHCPTCVAQAKLKWQPIGTLLPLGQSECRMNCACSWRFRMKPAA